MHIIPEKLHGHWESFDVLVKVQQPTYLVTFKVDIY